MRVAMKTTFWSSLTPQKVQKLNLVHLIITTFTTAALIWTNSWLGLVTGLQWLLCILIHTSYGKWEKEQWGRKPSTESS